MNKSKAPLLEVRKLNKSFPLYKGGLIPVPFGSVQAVKDFSFTLERNEILGIVGESGCGKTTLIKTLMLMEEPDSGSILYKSRNLVDACEQDRRELKREIQVIFQNPSAALNPYKNILQIIEEPLKEFNMGTQAGRRIRIDEVLELVGLPPETAYQKPGNLSGGMQQRVAIARALATNPDILIADESVSALDVSIQARILNLLKEISGNTGIAMIFISHDLSVIRYICNRLILMKSGKIVESGPTEAFFKNPESEYAREFIQAARTAAWH